MHFWATFNCVRLNTRDPIRLAGTCKQYSASAIIQLTKIAAHSASDSCFKWPYQANVMKMLEQVKSKTNGTAGDMNQPAGERLPWD